MTKAVRARLQAILGRTARALSGDIGFTVTEALDGEHEFAPPFGPAEKRPMGFRVTWGPRRLGPWLDPAGEQFLASDLWGSVTVDGLCREAPCAGRLELRYLRDRSIRYVFDFEVNGTPYRFAGEKVQIRPWNLPWSHTTCFGTITRRDTGQLVSTSVVRFRLRRLPAFLASFRLVASDKDPRRPPTPA